MIGLIQRVSRARITIDNCAYSEIGSGILAFIGIEKSDTDASAEKMLDKMLAYRIFADSEGRMNLNLKDVAGGLMLVSQFTLAADTNSGLRPGFSAAMNSESAKTIYLNLVECAKSKHEFVESGQFAADMQIELENDGPVTFILSV